LKTNRTQAYLSIAFSVILLIAGIIAYNTGYVITWFGIRLSGPIFFILAGLMLASNVYALLNAKKADEQATEKMFSGVPQSQGNSVAMPTGVEAPPENYEIIPVPCTISITRQKAMVGGMYKVKVYINRHEIGEIKNGENLQFTTNVLQNIIAVSYGPTGTYANINIVAVPGGQINLSTVVNKRAQVELSLLP